MLAVVVLLVLELTNTTHIFHHKKVPATIPTTATKSSSASNKKTASGTSSSGQAQDTKVASSAGGTSSTGASTGEPPAQPYGNFVSNHRPGENGSDTNEQSTCDTTPGATCYIQFTNTADGTVTKLPVQTVGSDGSTFWSWDSTILTSGEWKITAVAELHGQTRSADDTIRLLIK